MKTLFVFGESPVRVVGNSDNPLFVAADVCRALGIVNNRHALERLPDDEKVLASDEWSPEESLDGDVGKGCRSERHPLSTAENSRLSDRQDPSTIMTGGGPQQAGLVTESGLYRLIFRSDKPQAERFRKWVFAEVLPSIRRTGGYFVDGVNLLELYRTAKTGRVQVSILEMMDRKMRQALMMAEKPEKGSPLAPPVDELEFWQAVIDANREGYLGRDLESRRQFIRIFEAVQPHPPEAPDQGVWKRAVLYINPSKLLARLEKLYAARSLPWVWTAPTVRAALSVEPYWIEGDHKQRFKDSNSSRCWAIDLDLHPMGYQRVTTAELNMAREQGRRDPRLGELYELAEAMAVQSTPEAL